MEKTTITDKNGREVQTLLDYDGYRFAPYTPGLDPVEHLQNLATLEFQDTDICVLAYPKSVIGGSWIEWMTQLQAFEQDNPDYPILNISYEDMKKDIQNCVRRVDTFLGLGSTSELISEIATKCDFEVMSKFKNENLPPGGKRFSTVQNHHIIYRKGGVGDWKNHFTVGQDELFNKRMKEQIADLRLQIIYTI